MKIIKIIKKKKTENYRNPHENDSNHVNIKNPHENNENNKNHRNPNENHENY